MAGTRRISPRGISRGRTSTTTTAIRGQRAINKTALDALKALAPEDQARATKDLIATLREFSTKARAKMQAAGGRKGSAGGAKKPGGGRKASATSTRRAVAAKGGRTTATRRANTGTTGVKRGPGRPRKNTLSTAGRKGGEVTAAKRTRRANGTGTSRRSRKQAEIQAPSTHTETGSNYATMSSNGNGSSFQ